MIKKIIFLILLIGFIGGVMIVIRGDEDDWICQKGIWVKHGNPVKPMPSQNCPK